MSTRYFVALDAYDNAALWREDSTRPPRVEPVVYKRDVKDDYVWRRIVMVMCP